MNVADMKVAIVGPICRDMNIVGKKRYVLPGGVTFYTGQAFFRFGVKNIIVLGSCGSEDIEWASGFDFKFVHTGGKGTIEFANIYSGGDVPRRQRTRTLNTISVDDIPLERLTGLDYLIFGPLHYDDIFPSTIREFAKRVDVNTKLVLAPQGMIRYIEGGGIVQRSPENVLRALPYVDYAFLHRRELEFISGEEGIEEGARLFQDLGVENVIVTLGGEGLQLFLGDKSYKIRAFPAREEVDTTGAGDTVIAALLVAEKKYDDPMKQGRFAAMAATMAIERKGPFSGTVEEVMERLNSA